jgi:phage antirepressor YoqD-like protein
LLTEGYVVLSQEDKEHLTYSKSRDKADSLETYATLRKDINAIDGIYYTKKQFMAWLHKHGYICEYDGCKDFPTQLAQELGYFKVDPRKSIRYDRYCDRRTKYTIRITQKGARHLTSVLADSMPKYNCGDDIRLIGK